MDWEQFEKYAKELKSAIVNMNGVISSSNSVWCRDSLNKSMANILLEYSNIMNEIRTTRAGNKHLPSKPFKFD